MSRCLALLLVFVWALVLGTQATAQRTAVVPNDAELIVTIENSQDPFLESEMVLLTIHGIYRRYITRCGGAWRFSLAGPDRLRLALFNTGSPFWMRI